MASATETAELATVAGPEDEVFVFPMSYPQRQLWLLDQSQPGDPAYNLSYHCSLSGDLDLPALDEALNHIVERHEILRTTFVLHDGEPVQLVSDPSPVGLPLIDLGGLPEEVREAEGHRLGRDHDALSFDLEEGPLLRVTAVRLAADEHFLLLTLHHIVSDAWSLGILVREIVALYAPGDSAPSPLAELPIQYADFAVWQQDHIQGEKLAEQLDFWRGQLGTELSPLELPADRPLPSQRTSRGGSRSRRIAGEVATGLEALSQERGATLFATVLAAFQLLLHRLSGEDDVTVGVPSSGRSQLELEGLIGYFVNPLAIRSRVAEAPPFASFLDEARRRMAAAQDHQDLPFELLVEELEPRRDVRFNPIYPGDVHPRSGACTGASSEGARLVALALGAPHGEGGPHRLGVGRAGLFAL